MKAGKGTLLAVLGIVVIAAGSTWVYQQLQVDDQEFVNPASQPDQYIIHLVRYEYDTNGKLESTVQAEKAIHYKDKNTTLFLKPHVTANHAAQTAWEMQAEHGLLQSENDVIHLWGNVRIHQPEQKSSPETTIETKQVTYFPHRKVAETNRPVIITRPGVVLEAEGMSLDLQKGVIHTAGHTRGSYEQK